VKALRWREDVDLIARTVTVKQQTCYGVTTTPKGRTRRTIPMTSTLEQALRRLEVVREGFVVRNLDGSAKTDGQANAVILRICRRAGLPEKRWHTLRHNAESRIIRRARADGVQHRRRRQGSDHAVLGIIRQLCSGEKRSWSAAVGRAWSRTIGFAAGASPDGWTALQLGSGTVGTARPQVSRIYEGRLALVGGLTTTGWVRATLTRSVAGSTYGIVGDGAFTEATGQLFGCC
jgi:Phage integrase family